MARSAAGIAPVSRAISRPTRSSHAAATIGKSCPKWALKPIRVLVRNGRPPGTQVGGDGAVVPQRAEHAIGVDRVVDTRPRLKPELLHPSGSPRTVVWRTCLGGPAAGPQHLDLRVRIRQAEMVVSHPARAGPVSPSGNAKTRSPNSSPPARSASSVEDAGRPPTSNNSLLTLAGMINSFEAVAEASRPTHCSLSITRHAGGDALSLNTKRFVSYRCPVGAWVRSSAACQVGSSTTNVRWRVSSGHANPPRTRGATNRVSSGGVMTNPQSTSLVGAELLAGCPAVSTSSARLLLSLCTRFLATATGHPILRVALTPVNRNRKCAPVLGTEKCSTHAGRKLGRLRVDAAASRGASRRRAQ